MIKTIQKMRAGDEGGFTLVELLIVIAIIAILAAIAIPQFATYRERATQTAMIADGKNISTALETYASDNNGAYTSFSINSLPSGSMIAAPVSARASANNSVIVTNGATPPSYTITVINTNAGSRSVNNALVEATMYTIDNLGNAGWQ